MGCVECSRDVWSVVKLCRGLYIVVYNVVQVNTISYSFFFQIVLTSSLVRREDNERLLFFFKTGTQITAVREVDLKIQKKMWEFVPWDWYRCEVTALLEDRCWSVPWRGLCVELWMRRATSFRHVSGRCYPFRSVVVDPQLMCCEKHSLLIFLFNANFLIPFPDSVERNRPRMKQ